MKTILLGLPTGDRDPERIARVRALAPDYRLLVTVDDDEIEAALDEIEIAAARVPRSLTSRGKSLRWMQQWGAGADWLMHDPEAVAAKGIKVTRLRRPVKIRQFGKKVEVGTLRHESNETRPRFQQDIKSEERISETTRCKTMIFRHNNSLRENNNPSILSRHWGFVLGGRGENKVKSS